jgi:hypothetical protein
VQRRKRSNVWPGTQIAVEVGAGEGGLWEAKITGVLPQGEFIGRRHASRSAAVDAALAEMERRNEREQAAFRAWIADTKALLTSDD